MLLFTVFIIFSVESISQNADISCAAIGVTDTLAAGAVLRPIIELTAAKATRTRVADEREKG